LEKSINAYPLKLNNKTTQLIKKGRF